jgi:hypothetical protein
MVPIEGCDGRGHIPVGDSGLEMRLCRNLFAKALRQHLGSEISNVQHVKVSPLLQRKPGGGIEVDHTKDNLLIQGTWPSLLPHIKLALASKGLSFSFRIVTDQQIKTVYVGDEHRSVRSSDKEACNSVADLLGVDYDLVIVKLGYLGHKNKAAPGALKEALLVRKDLNLPTWVVEDPQFPWTHSRNIDVEQFIDEHYEIVLIDGTSTEITPEPDDMGTDPDPDEGVLDTPQRVPTPRSPRLPIATLMELEDLELPGETKKKGWRK